MTRPSVGWVVTIPSAVRAFVAPYLVDLARDHDVTLYVNGTADEFFDALPSNIEVVTTDLRRPISLIADFIALVSLTRAMRLRRHRIVHTMLPKSGLLGMTAASIVGVPTRIHMFTGQVWANKKGWRRWLLRQVDRWTASRATVVMADSPSQCEFLVAEQVARSVRVIGPGSVCGVDSQRFAPNPTARGAVRRQLGITDDSLVIGFLGRINKDKGIPELIAAFREAALDPRVLLVLFGPDEDGLLSSQPEHPRIVLAGPTAQPEAALAAMDLFCLPSYREGFGVSVLEASATGLPVIASRIYGLTDAVVEGETGWLVPPGDVTALAGTLLQAMTHPAEMSRRGQAGRDRALQNFAPSRFIAYMRCLYSEQLAEGR